MQVPARGRSRAKSWQLLGLLYLAAPAAMLLAACLLPAAGGALRRACLLYGQYGIDPLPSGGGRGAAGLALALLMMLRAVWRNDRRDLYLTVTFANACLFAFLSGAYASACGFPA